MKLPFKLFVDAEDSFQTRTICGTSSEFRAVGTGDELTQDQNAGEPGFWTHTLVTFEARRGASRIRP